MGLKKGISGIFFLLITVLLSAQNPEFVLQVNPTFERLVSIADTDGDKKITIEDHPKSPFWMLSQKGDSVSISKIYHLSNLLQQLAMAREQQQQELELSLSEIEEAPSARISRRIKEQFWDDLTRSIDKKGLKHILKDTKAAGNLQRLYVPADDSVGIEYFKGLQNENFEVIVLPEKITPQYVKSINDKPGLLSLKLEDGKGVPFVVPGRPVQ